MIAERQHNARGKGDVYKRQVTIHSTQSKYFVASRKFELPELKLLIDAVESVSYTHLDVYKRQVL